MHLSEGIPFKTFANIQAHDQNIKQANAYENEMVKHPPTLAFLGKGSPPKKQGFFSWRNPLKKSAPKKQGKSENKKSEEIEKSKIREFKPFGSISDFLRQRKLSLSKGVVLEGGLKTDFLEVAFSSFFLGIFAPSAF